MGMETIDLLDKLPFPNGILPKVKRDTIDIFNIPLCFIYIILSLMLSALVKRKEIKYIE